MRIILNNYIPFKGFLAINLFGNLFVRKDKEYRTRQWDWEFVVNHEEIHTQQMKDFCKWLPIGGLLFYIVYLLEWLFKVLFIYPFSIKAYRNISFEKEAYTYETDLNYLKTRRKFNNYINKY